MSSPRHSFFAPLCPYASALCPLPLPPHTRQLAFEKA